MSERTDEQKRNLLKLVELMKFDPDPNQFTMLKYSHLCGAPACVLGHAFVVWPHLRGREWPMVDSRTICAHFGIRSEEARFLFGADDPWDHAPRFSDTPAIAAQRVLDVYYGGRLT